MGYWPSYEEISPSCRAAYLAWLADGRRDPSAYIGYVFLYFYGLERRVLHDYSQGASSGEERTEIFKEVKRLLKLYGDDNSFAQYGWQFLFAIYLSFDDIDLTTKSPVVVPRSYDLPVPLKVGLGQFAKAGKSIPAEWALAWVLQDREIRLRTPARRCSQEFATLFKHLYRDRFGEGIVVKPNKTPVSATYRPASGGMRRGIEIYRGPSLPDITILKRPRTMLSDIADQAANKLDAYSRFIGKEDNTKDSLQGAALLPPELDGKNQHPALDALRKTLESYLGDRDTALLPVGALLEHWSGDIAMDTLAVRLTYEGVTTEREGICLVAKGVGLADVRRKLQEMIAKPEPSSYELAAKVQNKMTEKYDVFLGERLLNIDWSSKRLDTNAAMQLVQQLTQRE